MAGGGKSLAALPKTPKGRASRILQGLAEEAQFGLPFLESRLLQELLQGAEGEKVPKVNAPRGDGHPGALPCPRALRGS